MYSYASRVPVARPLGHHRLHPRPATEPERDAGRCPRIGARDARGGASMSTATTSTTHDQDKALRDRIGRVQIPALIVAGVGLLVCAIGYFMNRAAVLQRLPDGVHLRRRVPAGEPGPALAAPPGRRVLGLRDPPPLRIGRDDPAVHGLAVPAALAGADRPLRVGQSRARRARPPAATQAGVSERHLVHRPRGRCTSASGR